MKIQISSKHIQISKANAQMVMVVAAAAFLTTFSLVASHALLGQRAQMARVIAGQEKAVQQLKANQQALDALAAAYREFVNRPQNVIGGNPAGAGERDGDNARLILDALPSRYDFPALTSSIEKLAERSQVRIQSLTGVDDEVAQQQPPAGDPKPIEMPLEVVVAGDYARINELLANLERSIRPFRVTKLKFSGSDADITLAISLVTYYVPAKTLNITTRAVE